MNITQIPLDQIQVGDRLRAVDEDWAAWIASDMAEKGQSTPIEVRAVGEDRYLLIAGGHRHRAAQIAGLETMFAIVRECSPLEAEMLEIDENLLRRELSELDRSTSLARRKELYEKLHPEAKHGANQHTGGVGKFANSSRFTAEVAEKLGISESVIQRSVRRYMRLAPDVRGLIAGTWLADHGAQLDALTKCDPLEQRRIVKALFREKNPPADVGAAVREIRGVKAAEPDHVSIGLKKQMKLWPTLPQKARDQFLAWLEEKGVVEVLARGGKA